MLSQMLYMSSRMLRQHNLNDAPLEQLPEALEKSLNLDMDKARDGLAKVLDSKDELQEMARQLTG